MSWRFEPMHPGDLNIDPIEGEFFATEALDGITDALVREAIQNSLDAALDERVRVRFCLARADNAIPRRYLDELWPHAKAALLPNRSLPNPEDQLQYLVVEDDGTRGLEGDPGQYEDDGGGGGRNDFYYFWRNVGRSRKESTERGRWGLGKTVFAAASRLNSFFGLTVRRADSRSLLMGQAVLKIHRLGDRRYRPYGYYGRHENGFTMPFDNLEIALEFEHSFKLRRLHGSGLSIVIPFPDREITAERLLESVLHHYFHPLLDKKLEVHIEGADGASIALRGEVLDRELRQRSKLRHLVPLIQLARWGLNPETEAVASLVAPAVGRAPRFTEDLFDAAVLEHLRQCYEEGRNITVDVHLMIDAVRDTRRETVFRLLMRRTAQDQRGEGYFVRQGITIENPNVHRPRGAQWLVVVSDPTLSAFLGDAENPAHTEWQRSLPKFKEKYRLGPSTLDFVRSFPARLASLLARPAEGRDQDLLREIFSLSTDAAMSSPQRPEPAPEGSERSTTEESIPSTLGRNGALVMGKVRTGFWLHGRADEPGPRRLEVLAAYDVLRGNPFQRYSPLDFRMDKSIAVTVRGARVVERRDNQLQLEIEAPEFELLVTRFDENRDLRVRVRPLEAGG